MEAVERAGRGTKLAIDSSQLAGKIYRHLPKLSNGSTLGSGGSSQAVLNAFSVSNCGEKKSSAGSYSLSVPWAFSTADRA
eukprot:1183871-Prorocentrum_minimum.AAC.7